MGFVDVAKGVGIISVVLFHSGFYPGVVSFLSAFKMQMFFVISGYLHKPGAGSLVRLRKRSRTILLPYLLFNLFLLLARAILDLSASRFSWRSLLDISLGAAYSRYYLYPVGTASNPCLLDNFNSPMWFLTALMSSSAIFFPLVAWIGDRPRRLLASSAGLVLAGIAASRLPILLPWSLDTAPLGALFMLLGTELSKIRYFSKRWTIPHAFGMLAAAAGFLLCSWYNSDVSMYGREYGNHGILSVLAFIAIGVFGSLLYIWAAQLLVHLRANSLLAFFGKRTVFILCLHLLVFHLIDAACLDTLHLDIHTRSRYWAYSLAKISLTLLTCSMAAVLFSRAMSSLRSRSALALRWGV